MSAMVTLQWGVVLCYLVAVGLLSAVRRWPRAGQVAVGLALVGFLIHLLILNLRWWEFGRLPIVTRYEDMTMDALMVVGAYLLAQWRLPWLRPAGLLVLPIAAIGVGGALWYNLGSFPWSPSLRTNWLIVHAELNSLAIGVGTLAAAASLVARDTDQFRQLGRLLGWAFLLWSAMVAAGSYWASLAWGRYWGWDPIESWSLGTLLAYAFVLHLRLKPRWQGRMGSLLALVPYIMMLFTTYGLLLVRGSIHGSYLFL